MSGSRALSSLVAQDSQSGHPLSLVTTGGDAVVTRGGYRVNTDQPQRTLVQPICIC